MVQHGGRAFETSSARRLPQPLKKRFRDVYQQDWKETEPHFLQWLQQQHPDHRLNARQPPAPTRILGKFGPSGSDTLSADGSAQSSWEYRPPIPHARYQARFEEQGGSVEIGQGNEATRRRVPWKPAHQESGDDQDPSQ